MSEPKVSLTNRALGRFGLMLVPKPPGAKSLHEHANVAEFGHPSRGGRTVEWMRTVADLAGRDEYRERA